MLRVLDFAEKRRHELANLLERSRASGAEGGGGVSILRRLRRRTTSHRRRKGHAGVRLRGKVRAVPRKTAHLRLKERLSRGDVNRLETHVWHAKRMRMEKQWGYILPTSLTRKPSKAVWRAVRSGCTVHDASYKEPVELVALQPMLSAFMAAMMDPSEHSDFVDESHLTGKRQGRCLLYAFRSFPSRCLGPVQYLWDPASVDVDRPRRLWLWIHAAMKQHAMEVLRGAKDLKEQPWSGVLDINDGLSDDLVLFELRGARSHEVAKRVLVPVSANEEEDEDEEQRVTDPLAIAALHNGRAWTHELRHLVSAAQLPEGATLALTVLDPRHCLPRDAGVGQAEEVDTDRQAEMRKRRRKLIRSWPSHFSQSHLWLKEVRDFASSCMVRRPDNRINAMRHQERKASSWQGMLRQTSSSSSQVEQQLRRNQPLCIPILAIVKGHHGAMTSGYDLVLPRAWGTAFWHRIIMTLGCRAVGIMDVTSLSLQLEEPSFPRDYIETAAGREYWVKMTEEEKTRQRKRPPGKRRAIPAAPWFQPGASPFVVIRNTAYVEALRAPVAFQGDVLPAPVGERRSKKRLGEGKGGASRSPEVAERSLTLQAPPPVLAIKTMALVLLESVARGVAEPLAHIFLPSVGDYQIWEVAGVKTDGRHGTTTSAAASQAAATGDAVTGWVTIGALSWARAKGLAFGLVHAEALLEQQRRAAGVKAHAASLLIVCNQGGTRQFLVRYRLLAA